MMSPNHDHLLEAAIDRGLKSLPEIPAPPTLIARVMRAIAQAQALPWFRRAWQTWPASFRVVSFAGLVLLFSGLCFGAWELVNLGQSAATAKYGTSLSALGALWNSITVLFGAVPALIKQLPKPLLIGCVAAVVFGYAMCVALGTFCFALVRNVHRLTNEN
jgi:uncharacterized membrane protein YesL